MKKRYTLGFMFSPGGDMVALIMKRTPLWQAGKMNGIGGKVEEFDHDPLAAQRREFREETGVDEEHWDYRLMIEGEHFQVSIFSCFSDKVNQLRTVTAEKVLLLPVNQVRATLVSDPGLFIANLQWIIPFLLDKGTPDAGKDGVVPIGGKIFY